MHNSVRVQEQDFAVAEEYQALTLANTEDGAVVSFVGRMRATNDGDEVLQMYLEHYPAMTENVLNALVSEATERWQLGRVRLVHRVGLLLPGDQIVWVGVTSPHRGEAFAACEFLMDALKTRAPFWKKETTPNGERWVDARQSDHKRSEQWSDVPKGQLKR